MVVLKGGPVAYSVWVTVTVTGPLGNAVMARVPMVRAAARATAAAMTILAL